MSKTLFRFCMQMLLAIVGLSSPATMAAPGPSFSCSKRMSADERAICENPRLTTLDHIANQGYLFLRAKLGKAQANKINLPLIRQRQKCKGDPVCIEKAQRESIRVFNQNGAGLEIPEPEREDRAGNEQNLSTNAPATSPEPAPATEPSTPSEAGIGSNNPPTTTAEPAPSAKTTTPTDAAAPSTTTPAPANDNESPPKAAPPLSPATTAEAPSTGSKSGDDSDEPIDRPPVESEATGSAMAPSPDAATDVVEATPDTKGSREWRPEIEKEIRAETELESNTTDALSREMAEADQIKPLSRQEKQVVESTKSKHRIAFVLAAILFLLVVAYAISKLKRDPGANSQAATRASSSVDPTGLNKNPPPTASAPPTTGLLEPLLKAATDTASSPSAHVRPAIEKSAAPASTRPAPEAWVWSQYKDKI